MAVSRRERLASYRQKVSLVKFFANHDFETRFRTEGRIAVERLFIVCTLVYGILISTPFFSNTYPVEIIRIPDSSSRNS